MDRSRRTAATARRKTPGGGSSSPIFPSSAALPADDAATAASPLMAHMLQQQGSRTRTRTKSRSRSVSTARSPPAGTQSAPQHSTQATQSTQATSQSPPRTLDGAQHTTTSQSSQTSQIVQIAPIAHNRRGSKSLHPTFSSSSSASANRGQASKRRSRTMDGHGACGLPDGTFDPDSPRKGGHTLRKTPRVDYTFEHVDDEVVVPNSTSSRAKKRKLDHAFDSEDLFASSIKTRRTSLDAHSASAPAPAPAPAAAAAAAATAATPTVTATTAPGLRRHDAAYESSSMAPCAQPSDDEDVRDTIEVGVSYSDMEEFGIRRDSTASTSSVDHSVDASCKSAPIAAAATSAAHAAARSGPASLHFNPSKTSFNQEENIDPQLRASSPATPTPIADVAKTAGDMATLPDNAETQTAGSSQTDNPATEQTAHAQFPAMATTSPINGQHVGRKVATAQPTALGTSVQVTADASAADERKELSSPNSPAAEEEMGFRASQSSVTDEIQQQLNGAEAVAVVAESYDATRTDVSAASPDTGETLSSKPDADSDETDTPRTTESFSIDASAKDDDLHVAKHAAEHTEEHVTEDATKSKDPAVDTTDNVESAKGDQSHSRSIQAIAVPTISIERIAEFKEADNKEGQKEQEVVVEKGKQEKKKKLKKVEEKALVIEKTKASPIILTESNEKHRGPGNRDIIAIGTRHGTKNRRPSRLGPSKPQPAPPGRWSHLTPYLDGEYVTYPEKKARSEDDTCLDEVTPEEKDGADKDGNDMEPMLEDNDDAGDPAGSEAQTLALNTSVRCSPVPDSMDPTTNNSPAPAADDADEGEMSDSQEPPEKRRYYRYRKLRDANEYVTAIENYENMSTSQLYEVLEAINVSLVQWQDEWNDLCKVVDDYENSLRRRVADAKFEARTKNITQHGVNYEEPDFLVKGYRAKEREMMSETRYLQGQDRIMSATYGFEYDPHPSKIGRQNPETQQAGIMTRGRSLRNQPKQTVKASEADEVTGKRQRRPVQFFDPATQDVVSRASTPVPSRGRRRRHPNNVDEDTQVNLGSSFNGDEHSDAESVVPKGKKRRGPRSSNAVANAADDLATPRSSGNTEHEEVGRSGRRRAARQSVRYDDAYPEFIDDDAQPELKQPQHQLLHHAENNQQRRKRHLLTLRIPKSKNPSEPSSAITDNGDSRPSTASSESSSHTAESSYSFRPKRQKRFRDDPEEAEEAAQAPPRKRGKRAPTSSEGGGGGGGVESSFVLDQHMPDAPPTVRKVHKIKVVRPAQDVRHETPLSTAGVDGDERPKDYNSMTKSEKMSASMKSRWANGNMAGAVEKRKATLAAKKAAQAGNDPKVGTIAPKPKVNMKPSKKEAPPAGHVPAGHVPAMPGINYSFSAHP